MGIISDVIRKYESELVSDWLKEMAPTTRRSDLMKDVDVRSEAKEFVSLLAAALESGNTENVNSAAYAEVREMLGNLSRSRAANGFCPSETASCVFSFKKPFIARLQSEVKDTQELLKLTWSFNELLDKLGLYTIEVFLKSREDVIIRQQQDMLELSTPVVRLWEGVLALPLIGTLDSARTQVVMESLLRRILETNSEVAIIDITGVPTVDTLVAQHLIKTVTAARLMGADCIISGIRPQIAQTIVHLGVNLADITTKSSMADAFLVALKRSGYTFVKVKEAS
ncbi:MAG TPA: STAS domain-containing protein [Terriglobales bacterium]